MPTTSPSVETLRRDIDAIDRDIQSLLERRGDIVNTLSNLKKSAGSAAPFNAMRPGREAEIVRRVIARHGGVLAVADLAGLWRGIISSYLRLQFPLTVHVGANRDGFSLWDLARIHFGPGAPLADEASDGKVVGRVAADEMAVGVVALPEHVGGDAWWCDLAPAAPGRPQVVARLPFVVPADSAVEALVIARVDRERSGDDITLVRVAGPADTLGGLAAPLGSLLATRKAGGRVWWLFAVPGYFNDLPVSFGDLRQRAGVSVDIIGGYAVPVRLKEAQSPKA